MEPTSDEWAVIQKLLPEGWEVAARTTGAFCRLRYTGSPSSLLRLLLFHAASTGGLRCTVAQAAAAGISSMSSVALFKRMKSSEAWLAWICAELCRSFREEPAVPGALRLRIIDSTMIQGPGSKQPEWRLHYMLNLRTLGCDWHELTDCKVGEAIQRAPVEANDVILGDRNFSARKGIRWVAKRGAHVLVRLRWCHGDLRDPEGRPFVALAKVKKLRVEQVGDWPVELPAHDEDEKVVGRVVAVRLPDPVAAKSERRVRRTAARKGKKIDPRTVVASRFVMLFTTIPPHLLDAASVLALYRYRWQVEVAFKRLKQLLHLGNLPHKGGPAARSWILAKLVLALLIEKLFRNAKSSLPWGYPIEVNQEPPG